LLQSYHQRQLPPQADKSSTSKRKHLDPVHAVDLTCLPG
jgi:hypothetical protein